MLPTLKTKRLDLRPFTLEDAASVVPMVHDYALYRTTLHLPYPYDASMAETWIASHPVQFQEKGLVTLAVVCRGNDELVGAISLGRHPQGNIGEIGYWVGRVHWGQGFASEALEALLPYGFDVMGLHRIQGRYLAINPASGRVMEKCGMVHEGILKGAIRKEGYHHDVGFFGLTRPQYLRGVGMGHGKLALRRAEAKDAYALHVIQEGAFAEDLLRYGDRSDCPARESFHRLTEKISSGNYHVLLENGTVIGGADVRMEEASGTARLARVYLAPDYQGMGFGGWFLLALEERYGSAVRWVLDTPHRNFRNQRFYESLGYVRTGERRVDPALTLFDYEKVRRAAPTP